jgi:geranylgeranylglycerol-phosphate geranylgeranyltransferase
MNLRKLKGMLHLFRPELSTSAGICLVTGQVLALGRLPDWRSALAGFLCAFMLSASALILNDYFDDEVDRINAPLRPIPSGAVTRTEALGLTVLASLIGLACASTLGLPALLISIVFWIVGILYNWRYKKAGLAGNLMVSTSVAITFILGAITVGKPWHGLVWLFSLMAFFIDLGEEIAGDAMDMAGDRQLGSHSIALLRGRDFALRITMACWGMVILLGLVPVLFDWVGLAYLFLILFMDGLIIFFGLRLLRSTNADAGHAAMRGVYIGGTLGILAFLLSML